MARATGGLSRDDDGEQEALRRIGVAVRGARGVDLRQYKRAYLRRRLAVRQRAVGLLDLGEYASHLARDRDEVDRLLRALTINVTEFFRNPSLFRLLREQVLPELLSRSRREHRPLQVWSAGCATGDEVLSLAILLDRLGVARDGARLLGTDIDPAAIAAARRGIVDASRLGELAPEDRRAYLAPEPDGRSFRVRAESLPRVRFLVHDLLAEPPRKKVDLLLCRNVLIYFELELQEKLLERITRVVRPGGVLVLGRVERLSGPARDRFEAIDLRERVYRKTFTGAVDAN